MVVAAGCYQQPEPPRQFVPGNDLHDQFTSEGNRLIVDDLSDDEAATLKLREHSRYTRVYDHNMAPVGRVVADDDGIHHRTVDAQTERSVETDGDTVRLADGWRVDNTDAGWHIDGADGDRLASWRRGDDGWTMSLPGDDRIWRVETDETTSRVVAGDRTTLIEVDDPQIEPVRLLALSLDELQALDRYTLAVWADDHLGS